MRTLIIKLHIYAGLLSFSHLVVYGIAGLVATAQTQPERPKVARQVREIAFPIAAGATAKQIADQAWRTLQLPLTRPMPDWFLRRTPAGDLLLDFYNVNGIYRVIVFEREQRLRIEDIRNSTWIFLEDVHAATLGERQQPGLMTAWAIWNEFAMWSLLGFCVSGVYLWLTSRSWSRWAYAALAAGTGLFFGLYFAVVV